MPRAPASLVHAAAATPTSTPTEQQPVASVDSDMVVILASFLCALICVLGLALVSRCACRFCRGQASSASSSDNPPPKAAEGLKKKAIDALPTVSYSSGTAANNPSDCAICLADFADGDALRVLPRCGHAFHVACVDAWLRTRATCPSCRAAAAIKGAAGGGPAQHQQPPPPGAAACGRCGSQVQVLVPTSSSTPGYDTFLP